ncbi:MAG: hypothetical protein JAZ11_20690 [Candidatus Thiodiazotropha lotti]|nr:hypothetical protein [Candidatus Thiodiazotropha lotti]
MSIDVTMTDVHAFLQQVERLLNKGSTLAKQFNYPEQEPERWEATDRKLGQKYPALLATKRVRARRRAQGKLNAALVRYKHIAVLLIRPGKDDCGILEAEKPEKGISKELVFQTSPMLAFRMGKIERKKKVTPATTSVRKHKLKIKIKKTQHYTVYLSKRCKKELKQYYEHIITTQCYKYVRDEFSGLTKSIGGYSGVNKDKYELRRFIVKTGRKHGRTWNQDDFPIDISRRSKSIKPE